MREQILQHIAKAHAQSPFREDQLQRGIGVDAKLLAQALDELYARREINRAEVTRKGETFGVVWPTGSAGVIPAREFVITSRKPAAATGQPKPPRAALSNAQGGAMNNTQDTRISQAAVLAVIAKRPETTRQQLIEHWGADKAQCIDQHITRLTTNGCVTRPRKGVFVAVPGATLSPRASGRTPPPSGAASAGRPAAGVGNNSGSKTEVPTPSLPGLAVVAAPRADTAPTATGAGDHETTGWMSFSVDSYGRLSIVDAYQVMVIEPDDAARLAAFVLATQAAFRPGARA